METILQRFHAGGPGMYPILILSLPLIMTAVKYAMKPERRFVPLLVASGFLAASSGILTFTSVLVTTFEAVGSNRLPAEQPTTTAMAGLYASVNCLALAFLFITVAAVLTSVGAWRLSRSASPAPAA